jgi:hypothetical protein
MFGFIRVRKRVLKGGHPMHRYGPTASMSFDIVRAVRIDGEPRHEFVLGLGSQQSPPARWSNTVYFWRGAISRMAEYGIPKAERSRLIADMIRKGARLPTPEEYAREREDAKRYGRRERDNSMLAELPKAVA